MLKVPARFRLGYGRGGEVNNVLPLNVTVKLTDEEDDGVIFPDDACSTVSVGGVVSRTTRSTVATLESDTPSFAL